MPPAGRDADGIELVSERPLKAIQTAPERAALSIGGGEEGRGLPGPLMPLER